MAETITRKALREAAAGDLGIKIESSITADADPVFTIPDMADNVPDVQKLQDAFLFQGTEWRRITDYTYPSTVTVTRTSGITTGAAQIYFFMTPDELNDALNEALTELYFEDIETISLVANTYVYTLPTWMQQKGQFLAAKWRDITSVATDPQEQHVASFMLKEDANSMTIKIQELLRDITTWDLQISGRHNYASLASDAATTTCPRPLIVPAVKVRILHKLSQKFGKGMMSLFGPKMVISERELMIAKSDWLPKLKAREIIEEEFWGGPDTNENFDTPSW